MELIKDYPVVRTYGLCDACGKGRSDFHAENGLPIPDNVEIASMKVIKADVHHTICHECFEGHHVER